MSFEFTVHGFLLNSCQHHPKSSQVRRQKFKRSFVKHLLVYALGRGPEWRDEPLIDEIARTLDRTPTVAAAVEAIALSDAFRRRPVAAERIEPASDSR